jgi:hypothetical protein
VTHRSRLRTFAPVVAGALAVLTAGPARAADPPPAPAAPLPTDPAARAVELKKVGDRAMDVLRFADAYGAYADVYAVTLDPALLYNMGRALQAMNRFPESLDRLADFDRLAPPALKARVPKLRELIAEVRARVTTLRVTCRVAEARVLVRSTVMSKLPLSEPLRLNAGKAVIEVEAEGYFPFHVAVDLPGGGDTTVEAKLFSKSTTGLLVVNASAPGSTVFVDELKQGLAPVEVNVPGGTHRVLVKNFDFRDYETTTVIPAGDRKDLDVKLLPPLIVTRWWFWTGIAVLGAGAGVLGYALTTERAPDHGTIAPGQVRPPSSFKVGATILSF